MVTVEIDDSLLVAGTDCPVINNTEVSIQLIQYCNSTEWEEIKYGDGFPIESPYGRDNSTFENVYIFCEHVNQPSFVLVSTIMSLIVFVTIILLMMGLGVTMEPDKIIKFAKRPVGATIATVVQFAIMPFVAYGLGLAFGMSEIKMLTMVILGCCPGGTLSNFMALLLRGDMNLSILMTSVSTIVGVGAIPLMIKLLTGFFLDPCTELKVDALAIIKPLAFTLVPCFIGMIIKKYASDKVCNIILLIGKCGMLFGMTGIIGANIAIYRMSLITRFPTDILIAISIIPVSGFAIGFFCAMAAREPPRSRRTIMLETGLKNAQICLAIMIVTFPPEKIGVLMMMPVYFVAFQIGESAVLAFIFTKVLQNKDEDEQDKMLEYSEPFEKAPLQREYSQRISAKTRTPVGSNAQDDVYDQLVVNTLSRNGSTLSRTESIDINCSNCGHHAGILKTAEYVPSEFTPRLSSLTE